MYDIILQNNASKEFFVLSGLQNTSFTELYLQFEGVELPEEAQDGEYTYAVVKNERQDVIYAPKTPILDTIATVNGEDFILRDLCPLTGLLRVGKVEETNVYDEGYLTFPYDDKKEAKNDNNTTLYYEG